MTWKKADFDGDDVVVKGCGPDINTDDPDCITYTETGDDRCLDTQICNDMSSPVPVGCPTGSKYLQTEHSDNPITYDDDQYYDVFSCDGEGVFCGFALELSDYNSMVRLEIDGCVIFEDLSLKFLDELFYGDDTFCNGVFKVNGKRIQFCPKCPIRFATNFKIQVKSDNGEEDVERYMAMFEKMP